MTQGFFQFNNSIINEIRNFAISSFDLLFMSGPRGSAKSETIEKMIPELEENNLVFQHFCFENTVIDDFLLNFYDALRNFSIAQKISLKKFLTDNFKDKVSKYSVLGVEMESFALFVNAKLLGKRAATLLMVSDSFTFPEQLSSLEREQGLDNMITLALESVI